MHWYIRHTVDLEKPSTDRDSYTSPLYLMLPGDNAAHVWQVSVYSGGEPVNLTGQTVQAFFTRADGVTVALPGTVQGNTAAVTLARDVYLCRGEVRALMCLGDRVTVETDPALTLKEATFCVKAGVTNLTDPETVFPTISGLAEDLATLEGTVTNESARIDALAQTIAGAGWQSLGAASGVLEGLSSMGTHTGSACSYRVVDGNHVIASANVATSSLSNKVLSASAIPPDLQPASRIVRICPVNGPANYCRAYVESKTGANPGMIVLEWCGSMISGESITSITWSDIIIDWFI